MGIRTSVTRVLALFFLAAGIAPQGLKCQTNHLTAAAAGEERIQQPRAQDSADASQGGTDSPVPQPAFVASLVFQANAHAVSQPLVQARLAGRLVLLMVDSGARMTVLDPSLAAPTAESAQAAETSGEKNPVSLATNVPIEIGGVTLTLRTVGLSPVGEELVHDEGLYGFLSPQDLAVSMAILIDFPGRRLFGFRSAGDMAGWFKQMGLMKHTMAVSVRNQNGKMLVSATVGKGPPVWLELDTSTPDTVLPAGYDVGKKSKPEPAGSGGAGNAYAVFARQKISLGGGLSASATALVPLKGSTASGKSPRLGVDFLRHFMIGIPSESPKVIWILGE